MTVCDGKTVIQLKEDQSFDDEGGSGDIDKKKKYIFQDETDFDDWLASLDSRVAKKSFREHEEDIFKYSIIHRSFRNEFEVDNLIPNSAKKALLDGTLNFEKEDNSSQKTSVKVLIPGYDLNSFIPHTSSLTFNEMAICQEIIAAGGIPQNQQQLSVWTKCKQTLEEEQAQYIGYAKDQWETDDYKRQALVLPEIKTLVDLFWKARLERVYLCPKFYVQKENMPLVPVHVEEVELKLIKELETIGRPTRYFLPDLWTFVVNINTMVNNIKEPNIGWSQCRTMEENENKFYKEINSKLIKHGYNSDVSKDKVAERLAKEHGVNIVMSSSAFTYLIDSQPAGFNSVWTLPITVKEYQTDHGIKRIVFIDKKLPVSSMSAMDRIKYYAKRSLKKLFSKVNHDYRDPSISVYDADSVETFGVDGPVKQTKYKKLKKQIKIKCIFCVQKEEADVDKDSSLSKLEMPSTNENSSTIKCDDSDSDHSDNFIIDEGDETDKEEYACAKEVISNKGVGSKKDDSIGSNKDNSFSSKKDTSTGCIDSNVCHCKFEWIEEEADKSDKELNSKVVYNLWEFNSSASQNYMSKNCSKDLKLLIRTSIEGQTLIKRKQMDATSYQPYKLSPKLEFQPEYGAEVASKSETLRDWASIYIRPSSNLARVRLNAVTGELIQIQKLKTTDLFVECQRLHNMTPSDCLTSAHTILVKLSDLPTGTYLLCHKPQNGTFVDLYKSVESGSNHSYNLHLQYSNVDPTIVAPQRFLFPIMDPTIVTPTFKYFKRIPCTFAPKYSSKKSLLKDNSAVNPPSQGKKNKRKKRKKK